jgi:hypothetical protein
VPAVFEKEKIMQQKLAVCFCSFGVGEKRYYIFSPKM